MRPKNSWTCPLCSLHIADRRLRFDFISDVSIHLAVRHGLTFYFSELNDKYTEESINKLIIDHAIKKEFQ